MSATAVFPPIVSALVAAEKILGPDRQWSGTTKAHKEFVEKYFSKRGELSRYSESELRNWVSTVAAELNKVLEDEGFDIRLDEFPDGGFGVVSILDVLVSWLLVGEVAQIRDAKNADKFYPAVKFEQASRKKDGEYVRLFEVFEAEGHEEPVVLLPTQSGDRVGMTVAPKKAEGLKLAAAVERIRGKLAPVHRSFEYLLFPMVDLNNLDDISWLLGLKTKANGQGWEVAQAKQQTKFKMNQFGARVKSAVAIGFEATCVREKPFVEINRPFYLWIERPGAAMPVMYAYIDRSEWKDPGDLGSM